MLRTLNEAQTALIDLRIELADHEANDRAPEDALFRDVLRAKIALEEWRVADLRSRCEALNLHLTKRILPQ